MNKQRIAVLTDTGTNMPADYLAEHDVRVVPLRINFADGTSCRSCVDISTEELAERLSHEVPTTSLPSPAQVREALEQARADGYERAVFLTVSSGLSATNQTVQLVASQMKDFPVIVINTRNVGIAAGLLVMSATEMVEADVPFSQLERRLTGLAHKTRIYFSTKTLTYLRKGGRISEAVYQLGSVLDIKPVITCDEGGYTKVARKVRGWKKSLDAEVSLVAEHVRSLRGASRLAIFSSPGNDHFDELREKLRARLGEQDALADGRIVRVVISPDLLVHSGPDVVGMGVAPAWR